MSKFALISDVHLDISSHASRQMFTASNTTGADTLVVAGDLICTLEIFNPTAPDALLHQQAFRHFLTKASEEYDNVIYVLGNHEHWGSSLHGALHTLKKLIRYTYGLVNVHVLQNESIQLGETMFHGATLWTNVKNNDPLVAEQLRHGMARDYGSIQVGDRTMIPSDGLSEFNISLNYLDRAIVAATELGLGSVVVTHHHPSLQSIQSQASFILGTAYGYASDLSEFILDRPTIQYWCCGHIHKRLQYQIGETEILCNPRGYIGYETIANNYNPTVYEYK